MKRLFPIIVGVIVGITAGTLMIDHSEKFEAHGVGNTWSTYNFFEWNEIFSPSSKGQNLYNLVYNKRLVAPERSSIREVAQKYGLTQEEAQQAVDGSLTVLLSNVSSKYGQLSQDEAAKLIAAIQDDYDYFNTVFDLQQEIDLSVAPSEIFANGDIFDSGFDLVHDLDIIEEILFVQKTENTVGGSFDGLLDSPYLPSDENKISPYVADESPAAVSAFPDITIGSLDSESGNYSVNLPVGDTELPVNVLEEDICDPADQNYSDSLSQFEARENLANGEEQSSEENGGTSGSDQSSGAGSSGVQSTVATDERGNVSPAAAGNWLQEWCPGLSVSGGNDLSKNLSALGFAALGTGKISDLNFDIANSIDKSGFGTTFHAAICLETELIQQKVSLYNPGQSCVACEVESINEALEQTVSHSLIPNKVTGNIFESAKCKDAYDLAGLNMNIIAIANPIPTPPNDGIIGDPNIIEEWNSFVTENIPFVTAEDPVTDFALSHQAEGTSQSDVINEITKQQNADRTEAQFSLEIAEIKADLGNTLVYSQEVLKEIKQMNNYFRNFSKTYTDVNENACKEIRQKPTLD